MRRLPTIPHVACFDTAFHHDLPAVARRLPIPRRFDALGVRRYGFHGLSFAYLMDVLRGMDSAEANGRVILAHLGNGASLAAVRGGAVPRHQHGAHARRGHTDGHAVGRSGSRADRLPGADGGDDGGAIQPHRSPGVRAIGHFGDDRGYAAAARHWKRRTSGPPRRWPSSAITYANGSAPMPPPWADSIRSSLRAASASTRRRYAGGFAGTCGFWALRWTKGGTAQGAALISDGSLPVKVRVIATDEEQMIARDVLAALGPPAA